MKVSLAARAVAPVASAALAIAGLAAAPVAAQSAALDALPADCAFVLTVDGVDALQESWSESTAGQLWHDAAMDEVRDAFAALIDEFSAEAAEITGVDPAELFAMVHGPAAVALVELRVPEGDGEPAGAAAVILDLGEDVDVFAEAFDRLVDWAVEEEGLVLKTESYGGVDLAVLLHPVDEDTELRYGFADTMLVFTTESVTLGRDVFGEIVDNLAGEGDGGLSDAPSFAGSLAARPGEDLRAWMDLGAFIVPFIRRAAEADGALDEFETLGLGGLGELSMTFRYEEDGSSAEVVAGMRGDGQFQRMLGAAVAGQSPELLTLVPDSAGTTYALDIDAAGIFDTFLENLMEEDAATARDVIAGMAEMEAEIGFHPRDDLLENLDGQAAFFGMEVPVQENFGMAPMDPPQNFALLLGLSDGEAMSATLDEVVRSQGLHVARQREDFEGYTLYSVPFFPGLDAYYAVTDDLLVLSLSPSIAKDVLRRKGNGSLPSLASREEVAALMARLPRDRTMVVVEDAAAQMQGAFVAMGQVMPILLQDAAELPDLPAAAFDLLEALGRVDPAAVSDAYRDAVAISSLTLSEGGLHLVTLGP